MLGCLARAPPTPGLASVRSFSRRPCVQVSQPEIKDTTSCTAPAAEPTRKLCKSLIAEARRRQVWASSTIRVGFKVSKQVRLCFENGSLSVTR